ADEEQHREPIDQHTENGGHVLLGRSCGDLHTLLAQPFDQVGILRRNGGEAAALIAVRAGDAMLGDGNFRHIAGIHAGQKLRITDLIAAPAGAGVLKEIEQGHQQQTDDDPNREVPEIGIHRGSLMPWDASWDSLRAIRPQAPATPRRRSARSALGFNIGVYRKFAKRGWSNRRLARPGAAPAGRPLPGHCPLWQGPPGSRPPVAGGTKAYRKPLKRAEIIVSKCCSAQNAAEGTASSSSARQKAGARSSAGLAVTALPRRLRSARPARARA